MVIMCMASSQVWHNKANLGKFQYLIKQTGDGEFIWR